MSAEIKCFHEIRKKAQKDVESELRKLDEMGSLNEHKKPKFLSKDESMDDLTSEEVIFTLNDLYQFLKFEGESPESKSELFQDNYNEMEENLLKKIFQVQQSTLGKALKRIMKKNKTKEALVQTNLINYEEEMKKMSDEIDHLYKAKFIIKQENESLKSENKK